MTFKKLLGTIGLLLSIILLLSHPFWAIILFIFSLTFFSNNNKNNTSQNTEINSTMQESNNNTYDISTNIVNTDEAISSNNITDDEPIDILDDIYKYLDIDLYTNCFDTLLRYDLGQTLDEKFIASLKSSKELELDKYMKYTNTSLKPSSFVVLDFETTGLNSSTNEIIQIGAIKFDFLEPVEIFSTYIKPIKKISSRITSINGISNDMVSDSPSIVSVIPHLLNFIGDLPIIAHNAPFDMSFLYYTLFKYGYKKPKNKTLDTLRMARSKIKEYDYEKDRGIKLKSYKLEELKYNFDLYNISSHDALDDCKVCAYIYMKMYREYGEYVIIY